MATAKLQLSRLVSQTQLMVSDAELATLNLALKGKASIQVVEAITDGRVNRTIEGASTVVITIEDRDRSLLNSGRLTKGCDIKIDGLWFRLVGFDKVNDLITLTFEDREVAILRTYKKFMTVARSTISRQRFILKMINEVKEFSIPFVCPEIDKLIPTREIRKTFDQPSKGQVEYQRLPGFAPFSATGDVTVRGIPATPEQLDNTDRVLRVGQSRNAPYSCMVAAVMVINEESNARNLSYSGDGLSAGLFQQIFKPHQYAWGTKEEVMNIEWAANRFFDGAIAAYNKNPSLSFEYIALEAQVAGNQEQRIIPIWRRFRDEAKRTVARWGVVINSPSSGIGAKTTIEQRAAEAAENTMKESAKDEAYTLMSQTLGEDASGLSAASEDYQYTRGTLSVVDGQKQFTPEDTWSASGRLAEEINWRRFVVSGTFYLMSEPYMFRSKPIATINEDTPGVLAIDGAYNIGGKNAKLTVKATVGRWEAPPGSMIYIQGMGPLSGRWLVAEYDRNLFETTAEITLKKPRPVLPEPNLDQEDALTFTLPDAYSGSGLDGKSTIEDRSAYDQANVDGNIQQLRDLVNSKKVTFDHENDRAGVMLSGSVRRSDGQLITIDPNVVRFLVWAGGAFGVRVSSMIGSHSRLVAGSNRESRHWTGHAIDIGSISNKRVDDQSSRDAVIAFMTAVGNLPSNVKPNQQICNGAGRNDATVQALQLDGGHPKGGIWVGDHIDHVHIGY